MDNFYCTCDCNCVISEVAYKKGELYNIFSNVLGFYSIKSMDNKLIGFVSPYELESNFTTVLTLINEVDKIFNRLID